MNNNNNNPNITEDSVNIQLTEGNLSKQINNINLKSKTIKDNKINKPIINNNINEIKEKIEENKKVRKNNFIKLNSLKEEEKNEKSSIFPNPSVIIQNNNFYSQNNYQKNDTTEIAKNNTSLDKKIETKKNSKLYSAINKPKKGSNLVKAVVSINIQGEDKEKIDLVKQFNSLVDRLNEHKSRPNKTNYIKNNEKYYEFYKDKEFLFNKIKSPGKGKRKTPRDFLFQNNFNRTNDISKIFNSNNTSINLNSRIMALKEKSTTNNNRINISFRNDNSKNLIINNSDIVLPSNFGKNK
jgi:hypothetical protein